MSGKPTVAQHTSSTKPIATAKQVQWETSDGETYGLFELGENAYEITITGRIRPSMWTTGTNERTWSVATVYENESIGVGYEDGLRNAKRAALQALNNHLATTNQ